MNDEQKPEMTPQEKIAKLAAMSPEDFSAFMRWNFNRICKLPLPEDATIPPAHRGDGA
jgi:hypothetical protein